METPTAGIFTPVYNKPEHVIDFLQSILGQTRLPEEVSIVDNGNSSDVSKLLHSFITAFKSRGINLKILRLPENAGSTLGYNLAFSQLKTDIAIFASGDDIFAESRVERILHAHQAGHIFVHSAFQYFGNRSDLMRSTTNIQRLHLGMLFQNIIGLPTVSVDTRMLTKNDFGLFQHRQGADDYALWCHLLSKGLVPYYIDETLMFYRVHQDQITANFDYGSSSVLGDIQQEWFVSLFGLQAGPFRNLILRIAKHQYSGSGPLTMRLDSNSVRLLKGALTEHAKVAPSSIGETVQSFLRIFSQNEPQ
jgi:teichuronic acid biosynthesis glycosyltransferase TuaG